MQLSCSRRADIVMVSTAQAVWKDCQLKQR
jgi:hypothetical protein